jgi:2'-phosphotransferase
MRPDGYAYVSDVLSCKECKRFKTANMVDVKNCVETNDKKRLELLEENGDWLIRAVQGHSMDVVKDEELLISISADIKDKENVFIFPQVVHGTYHEAMKFINQTGLCKM